MKKNSSQCPCCGNITEGEKIQSRTNKIVRESIKGTTYAALKIGGKFLGKFIGEATHPMIGRGVGRAFGELAENVNGNFNKFADSVENNLLEINYKFTCSECGYVWTNNESVNNIGSDKDINIYETDDIVYEQENECAISNDDYLNIRIADQINHYSLSIVNSDTSIPNNLENLVSKVNIDLGIQIYDWQIKGKDKQEVYDKLYQLILNKTFTIDKSKMTQLREWDELISNLSHGDIDDNLSIEVYRSGKVQNKGEFISGAVLSGTVSVGDEIVLYTTEKNFYKVEVTWIEMLGVSVSSSEAGDCLGLGISFLPKDETIDMIYHYADLQSDADENDNEADDDDCMDKELYEIHRLIISIQHYCWCIITDGSEEGIDYEYIIKRVRKDTQQPIIIDKIKGENKFEVHGKLVDYLMDECKLYSDSYWHNIVKSLPQHGDSSEDYVMAVYGSTYVEDPTELFGDTIMGVNIAGTINVGDLIVLCTHEKEKYEARVTWIEMLGNKYKSSESGDTIGMGVDIDLRTIQGTIQYVYKYEEFYNDYPHKYPKSKIEVPID